MLSGLNNRSAFGSVDHLDRVSRGQLTDLHTRLPEPLQALAREQTKPGLGY
jgi:hypothetical protein